MSVLCGGGRIDCKTARNKGATKGPCKITDNPLLSQQQQQRHSGYYSHYIM